MFFGWWWWCNIEQVSIEYSMWNRIQKGVCVCVCMMMMIDRYDGHLHICFLNPFFFVLHKWSIKINCFYCSRFYRSHGRKKNETEVDKLICINERTWTMMLFFLMIDHYIAMHLKNHKHVHTDHISYSHRSLETCFHIRFHSILMVYIHIYIYL